MRVLFIGGTGNISSACVERALALGYDVSIFNRGRSAMAFSRPVTSIVGDCGDQRRLREVAESGRYDVVAQFVAYTPDQVELDIEAFRGQVGQYVFISTASAYQKPPNHYLITESTPLRNPFWRYSQDKIACEDRLVCAYREENFPVTIVRPSYTFGPTWIPAGVGGHGYTVVHRMRHGQPIVSHGDGQSLWVITFHTDFALGFVGLFGRQQAIGEAFHITSDEVLTWDAIYRTIANAAGCDIELIHVPSDLIAELVPAWAGNLLGDKSHSVVFDNSKIKRIVPEFRATVPFAEGIARSLAWFGADPARQQPNPEVNHNMDRIIAALRRASAP